MLLSRIPDFRRLLTPLLAASLLAVTLVNVAPTPVSATGGSSFTSVVNRYRAEAGVGPVALQSLIDQVAVERGQQLANARQLGHDFAYVQARFAQLGICWEQLGEIVAMNSAADYERFASQWYNSPPHRTIMLGAGYTHVGGSWSTGSDGRHYAVMIFAKLCGAAPAPAAPPVAGFHDIGQSAFQADIAWLVGAGITNGCAAGYFCPTQVVAREQMASFLRRARGLPASPTDYFNDDWSSGHQPDINSVAYAGITAGCAAATFCPRSNVSRDQMATFLVRALGLPPTGTDFFTDDNDSRHQDSINRLAAAGITTGCALGRYCPSGNVTREQMAAFLHRAFD